jgi:AraC-like DNA-binding protein
MEKPSAQKIPGEVWRSMNKEWLWVYRGTPPKVDSWSPDILVPPGVFFVEKGLAVIQADGREIRVPEGSAFFSAPGLRRQWLGSGSVLLSVGFRCSWPDGTPLHRKGLNCVFRAKRVRKLELATQKLFRSVHGLRKNVTYLDAVRPETLTSQEWCHRESSYLTWFCAFSETLSALGIESEKPQSSSDRLFARVLDQLSKCPLDSFQDSELSVLGIGSRRVDQLLQARLGLTARAWHERRRLENAKQRLLQENTPLKEIGYALGFRHASHFTAWFKRHNGASPTAFRQSAGQGAA